MRLFLVKLATALLILLASNSVLAQEGYEYNWLPEHKILNLPEEGLGVYYTQDQFQILLWLDGKFTDARSEIIRLRILEEMYIEQAKTYQEYLRSKDDTILNLNQRVDEISKQFLRELEVSRKQSARKQLTSGLKIGFIGVAAGLIIGYVIAR